MKIQILILLMGVLLCSGEDWPRWMGVNSDGVWKESGIRRDLPKGGAPVMWRVPVGWGYSGPAVANGFVYLSDYQRTKGSLSNHPGQSVRWEGRERLLCLDIETGQEQWKYEVERAYDLSYPGGPRATPTIANGLVYFLGAMGDLVCLDAQTGKKKWERDFKKDFGAPQLIWGFSSHPLVVDGVVYCLAGGEGSLVVALDASTGQLKWKALSSATQGYCPPTMVKAGGVEQLLIWHPSGLDALNPKDGLSYWSLPLKPNYGMSVMAPQLYEGKLFASGMGRVGAMIKLDDLNPEAKFLWKGKPKSAMYCCNSTPLIVDGVIYGSDIDSSYLIAASVDDGTRYWQTHDPVFSDSKDQGSRYGTVYLAYHEANQQFWMVNDSGDLILAELSKEKYQELGRQHLLEPTNEAFGRPVVWSTPAYAQRSVLMRNDKELVRVDLSEP